MSRMNDRAPPSRIRPPGRRTLAAALRASAVLACLAALAGAAPAQAQEATHTPVKTFSLKPEDRLRLAYTPRVFHVTNDDDYVDWNHIVALEWLTPRHTFWGADRTHFGIALFDNSYGQFSQSVYAGLEWDWKPALGGNLFLSLSAGLVHGYKEPYEDKLPLNNALGIGVTVVPAIAWQRGPLGLAVTLSGSAFGLRFSYLFER
jgi:hypothetical protein